jgi:hypothetical protein
MVGHARLPDYLFPVLRVSGRLARKRRYPSRTLPASFVGPAILFSGARLPEEILQTASDSFHVLQFAFPDHEASPAHIVEPPGVFGILRAVPGELLP